MTDNLLRYDPNENDKHSTPFGGLEYLWGEWYLVERNSKGVIRKKVLWAKVISRAFNIMTNYKVEASA